MFWATLEAPWQGCLSEAWAAYCAGSLPIGAVVTDAAGQIVARGRNRILEPSAEEPCLHGNLLAHAEMNALNAVDYRRVERHGCVLWTTTEPCPLCIGAARMIGVQAIHYASRDAAAGSIDLLGANAFMRRRPIQATGPQRLDLEAIIVALHVAVRLREDAALENWVVAAWNTVVPAGVALGRALHADGSLTALRAGGVPAPVVLDTLAARLLAGG
ncbi:MAG: nucleoside deaminase [Chloroflexota bacterium]|nr:nucleoside deaminase [Chloroflexota bacterium]